jgi:hypothetical protein
MTFTLLEATELTANYLYTALVTGITDLFQGDAVVRGQFMSPFADKPFFTP